MLDVNTVIFDIEPIPKGRPRMTKKGWAYTPKRTKDFEQKIKRLAEDYMKSRKLPVLTGAVYVAMEFYLKRGKTVKRVYHTVRPDLDNFIKAIKDACNGVIWKDDSQIVRVLATKNYGDNAYIRVMFKEVYNEKDNNDGKA
jgi:Holliday junction resolvase RusA-like endonuclease